MARSEPRQISAVRGELTVLASRNICVIPTDWTVADYVARPCETGSHRHLSRAELAPFLQENRVILLSGALGEGRREQAKRIREKIVVWILPAKGAETRSPMMPGSLNRGLSFHVGEELAKRIRQRHGWALTMFAEIRRRPIDESAWGES